VKGGYVVDGQEVLSEVGPGFLLWGRDFYGGGSVCMSD
jgi:hypothetical protein